MNMSLTRGEVHQKVIFMSMYLSHNIPKMLLGGKIGSDSKHLSSNVVFYASWQKESLLVLTGEQALECLSYEFEENLISRPE